MLRDLKKLVDREVADLEALPWLPAYSAKLYALLLPLRDHLAANEPADERPECRSCGQKADQVLDGQCCDCYRNTLQKQA